MHAAIPLPCIRCGECARVCPAQLSPQRLHHTLQAGDETAALAYRLPDCSECGACDEVCPSRIALMQQFRHAKQDLRQRAEARATANAARERFLARNERLARDEAERAERDAARSHSASSVDAVQAALERARARKRGVDTSE